MRIFVTGGHGFLGGHLCRALRNSGHTVDAPRSSDCDLRRETSLAQFEPGAYDRIYHLAAWTQAGDFCLYHPGEQWIQNQLMNTHVLRWWQESQPQAKLIAIGSSCCYEPGTPHVEENFLSGTPTESLFTYAMTKRMLYVGLRSLAAQYGLKYLMAVPSTLYGPDYHLDGRQMHFIFDLMRKIIDGKEKGTPVVLWGDGTQRRELIHVRDFVSALLQLSDMRENDLVNIGGGTDHTIREFAALLCQFVGLDASIIQYDTTKYVGAKEKLLIINRLQLLLPQFRSTPLAEGLRETVQWYREAHS